MLDIGFFSGFSRVRCYNRLIVRDAVSLFPLQKDFCFMSNFDNNTQHAKIQGLSIQAGELFSELYADSRVDSETTEHALEAYKSLRRLLPLTEWSWASDHRHIGHRAAHNSTQPDNRKAWRKSRFPV